MREILNLFLFDGLDDHQKKHIVNSLPKPESFKKGDVIYDGITFLTAIGFIVSGSVSAVDGGNGEVVMKNFSGGQCFGAAAVFGSGNSYVSLVRALSDTKIIFISEELLRQIFELYPITAINYIKFLSEKVRFLNNKLSVIACQTAEDSLYRYLSTSATDDNGYAVIPRSMTLLAKLTGLSRASLYRSLATLEQRGLITRENNHIRVNEK